MGMKLFVLQSEKKRLNMVTNKYQLLSLIKFKNLDLWDVKRYLNLNISFKHPSSILGSVIEEQKETIKPKLFPDEEFKILGVNNKVGLFDAYLQLGAKIKQPYKIVKNGYLIYNPYRVNVGSIGLKTDLQNHNLISNAYVVFSCTEKLLPEFLYRLFQTNIFNKIIRFNTSGSVRQNLTFQILSNINIPIPSIDIQSNLLIDLNNNFKAASDLLSKSLEKEKEILEYIYASLKVSPQNVEVRKGLHFVKYNDIARWGVDYNLNQSLIQALSTGSVSIFPLGNFIISSQYGLSEKLSKEEKGIPVLRMNNIYNGELDISDLKYLNKSKEKLKSLLLCKGDLLFNRTNSKELVGKTAVFDIDGDYTFASYLIRLKLDTERVNIYYINYLFNSPIIRQQIDLVSRQILGQANINSRELGELMFPIPSLEKQNEIVNELNKLKLEINELKLSADKFKTQALQVFEKELFN